MLSTVSPPKPSVRVFVTIVALIATLMATSSVASAAAHTCGGEPATIVGTEGDDRLVGTPGTDVIVGLGGKDKIFGLEGRDIICGGRGRDRIFGGSGADHIWGNGGNDRLNGQSGKDVLYGGIGDDHILGRVGDDKIHGGDGDDRLFGGRGFDEVSGGDGDDTMRGDDDHDMLNGQLGTDHCLPGDGTSIGCELPKVLGSNIGTPYEVQMFSLINSERSAAGLPGLARHPELDSYARDWAREMSSIPLPLNGSQHHSPAFTGSGYPFRGLPDSVYWTAAYENVGYATIGGDETPATTVDRLFYSPNGFGFMSSDGHRCNILETAANQFGLGAFVDSNGAVWVVQVFWGTQSPRPAPLAQCAGIANR